MDSLKNRLGTIKVTKELIESANKDILKAIFSEVYPIAIKEHADSFYYLCMSEHFEEKKKKDPIPRYSLSFTFLPNGLGKMTKCEKI